MSFAEAWEERLPRLAGTIGPSKAYRDECGACELRLECKWCPVFAYLEHRDHSGKIEHLCAIARETRRARAAWRRAHSRRFVIAGLTVEVESALPIADGTFGRRFEAFRAPADGAADVVLRHHFSLPELDVLDLGREIYRRPPWAIYRKGRSWIYLMISPDRSDPTVHRIMVFDEGHTRGRIFSPSDGPFRSGGLDSLAMLPSDQLILARVLPAFGGLYVHAAGVEMDGHGLVFAGPSEAGKSTMAKLIGDRGRVLCDDRIVVRRAPGGFRVHGTWNHGEIERVSPGPAPLRAILFLRQARANRLDRVKDAKAVLAGFLPRLVRPLQKDIPSFQKAKVYLRLGFLPRLVRPLVTTDWWERALALAGEIARDVPFYEVSFDRSGDIVEVLEDLLRRGGAR